MSARLRMTGAYLSKMQIVVGIITISDRASGGQYQDLGGPAVKAAAENHGWNVLAEAIREIMRLEIPGFGEVMRAQSMKITPNAILSRSLAAIVDSSLVIALPGKPSGAVECLGFVEGAIPHSVALAQRKPTSC